MYNLDMYAAFIELGIAVALVGMGIVVWAFIEVATGYDQEEKAGDDD